VLQIGPVGELVLLLKQFGGGTGVGGKGCGLCRGGDGCRHEKCKAKELHGILHKNRGLKEEFCKQNQQVGFRFAEIAS
jgi:hypothetical protein